MPSQDIRDPLQPLREKLRAFAKERDWQQFHSPKNLSMALACEAGELLEHFQWLSEEESAALPADRVEKIAEELADIQLYLVMLADKLKVDLLVAAEQKIERNRVKYPVELAKGKSTKYTDL